MADDSLSDPAVREAREALLRRPCPECGHGVIWHGENHDDGCTQNDCECSLNARDCDSSIDDEARIDALCAAVWAVGHRSAARTEEGVEQVVRFMCEREGVPFDSLKDWPKDRREGLYTEARDLIGVVIGTLDAQVAKWDEPVTAENHAAKLARIDALMNSADPLESLELRLTAGQVEHYEHIAFPLSGRSAAREALTKLANEGMFLGEIFEERVKSWRDREYPADSARGSAHA